MDGPPLFSDQNRKILEDCYNGIVQPGAAPPSVATLRLHINGVQFDVNNPDPHTSLNEFIRNQQGFKGTKVMCNEGGCGCCVVALTRIDPLTGREITLSVNSCLFPLYAANGCEVTTAEGIGNRKNGFHTIQKRVAEHNGSQCGFCTPGMVMTMYSLLKENPKPTKQQIEDSFDGNICRCTGYRPILDAMKTFAADAQPIDIEELSKCVGKCDDCKCKRQRTVPENTSGVEWYAPTSLAQLYAILEKHRENNVKLIAGNTGKGVYKDEGPFQAMVDINAVQELHCSTEVSSHLLVGSSVSLNSFINLCESKSSKSSSFGAFARHLRVVANTHVRNVGSLGGNLMLAHAHKDFPSDLMTIFEATGASLLIGGPLLTQVSLKEFKNTDMKGKVIVAIALPFLPENVFVNSFKITPRSQNAHAYVNAGFAIPVDRETMTVSSQPRMVYGGITYNFFHAENTEKFLVGKKLTDPNTLTEALEILDKEVVPEPKFIAHNGSTVAYHKDLALTLFYKAYIGALGDHAPDRLKSAARSILQERAVSSGIQNYESKPDRYPISNPMTKIAAKLQAAGEAQYVNDIPSSEGEVYGAFVISTKGNCKLDKVDPSEALAIPGVISYFDANDIPKDGVNEIKFFNLPGPSEGVFCKGEVLYVGHVIGMVVADTQKLADHAAKVVKVTYKDCKPLILTFEQAIEAKSYSPPLTPPWSFLMSDINVGDAEESMKSAKHVITGKVECGAQHHFHMETQVCLSEPKEDGITVYSATQGISFVQKGISEFLAVKATSVDVIVQRLGGAFGGKGLRSLQVACACALAAKILDRPVKMKVNFNTMMANQGGRSPHMAKYKVAVNDKGILQGVEMDYYVDTGCTGEDNDLLATTGHIDNLYYCPNWKVNFHTLLTSKASTTFCRAPGCVQGVFIMESIMEHVAKALNKTPEEIREKNLYEEGQKTPSGHPIPYCSIRKLWKDITKTSEVKKRQKEITEFNKANRWRKRGLVLVPGKFNIEASFTQYTVFVSIFSADGTVAIQHGGVEMGQGINVKVAQAAAYVLGVPMEMIIVKPNHTVFSPNSSPTGGSVGSETCVKGVMECCKMLNERIKPVREANPGVPWKQLIMMCGFQKVDLSAKYHARGAPKEEDYVAYGVTCTEAEVDILTGERLILRSDILFDCGESLNPEVDVGQVEGAFIFGMGYWMSEKVYYDEETGEELSTGTWTYKPPTTKDIPVDLRVTFLKDAPNPLGVLGSKASGEPPSTMSCACLFAIKRAVEEARKESGNDVHFTLNGPATVQMTQQSALIQREQLSLDPGVKKGQCFLSKK